MDVKEGYNIALYPKFMSVSQWTLFSFVSVYSEATAVGVIICEKPSRY